MYMYCYDVPTAADAMLVAAAYIPLAPVPRRLRCMWVLLCNLVIFTFVITTVISSTTTSSLLFIVLKYYAYLAGASAPPTSRPGMQRHRDAEWFSSGSFDRVAKVALEYCTPSSF
eukprot:COSAG02_NODE_916_length_15971_cov_12.781061_3_plen_115_part_00